MDNQKRVIGILLVLFILVNLISIYLGLTLFSDKFSITGRSSLAGGVIFSILGDEEITIHRPFDNEIHEFNKSLDSYYSPLYELDLNASATFDVDVWEYSIEQTTPRGNKNSVDGSFSSGSPRSLFAELNFFRWNNTLTVSSGGYSDSVKFFIHVNNSGPLMGQVDSEHFICENNALVFFYTVEDRDEDFVSSTVSPLDPFFTGSMTILNSTFTRFRFSSRVLRKAYSEGNKIHPVTVSASDGEYLDTKNINVNVIEVNNAPVTSPVGVQTVWTRGEYSVFKKQFWVQDAEDGNSSEGNLNFTINFLDSDPLFQINETGWMYFEPDVSHLDNGNPKTYSIEVCAEDKGIENPHLNITDYCNQDGGSIEVCRTFSLTVTNENRAPLIIDYYSKNLVINISGTENLYFNVSTYDPDGTIPDIYWYVDGNLKKYTQDKFFDEINHFFGCGVSGEKEIKVEITDGLLNDSIEWKVNVDYVACPVSVAPGGGGGGAGPSCVSEWVCTDWKVCQNLERSMKAGFLKGEDYRIIGEECEVLGYEDVHCGFQIRECDDLNECGTFFNIPERIQVCYFTEDPSCFDGIKNCHSGSCELGIDCGGPCKPCPTCSDGIQNQGEEGIDCGGPCPYPCPVDVPYRITFAWWYILVGLLLILLIILLIKWIRVLDYKKKLEENN
jgi:hypothetical protein